ncbi:MAG: type VI secretion system baseplate subunit TssE [Sphingomonadales bacterium]|nr:MAG: type VI secretion system baseplate subunit TssE [Sphingomonadales bacterium]
MAVAPRLNPTLFDKLVADLDLADFRVEDDHGMEVRRETTGNFSIIRLERFNERALRATVRRELAWLLNTTNLASVQDLEPFPHVQTSVLNYGVPDLAGRSWTNRMVLQRARDLRTAIRTFEPRIDAQSLTVEPVPEVERPNAITYIINADVTSAVEAMPVRFRTDIEQQTAAVTVRD